MNKQQLLDMIERNPRWFEGEFAAMFISNKEISDLCGIDQTKVDDIARLLTKIPEALFWYEHRGLFKKLVRAGYSYFRKADITQTIHDRNDKLIDEMCLKFGITLDYELRPLQSLGVFFSKHLEGLDADALIMFGAYETGDREFMLYQRHTIKDFLETMNVVDEFHGKFIEGFSVEETEAENTLKIMVHWGS